MKTMLFIFVAMLVAGGAIAQSNTADVDVNFTIPTFMDVYGNMASVDATFVDDGTLGDGEGYLVGDVNFGVVANVLANWEATVPVADAPWAVFSANTGTLAAIGWTAAVPVQVRRVIGVGGIAAGTDVGTTVTMTLSAP